MKNIKEEPKQDRTCNNNCSDVCGECQIFEPKQETSELNYKEITWSEREKYGCIGTYLINRDIYEFIPSGWRQTPKLRYKKGTIIEVVKYNYRDAFEEQFETRKSWFKREQLTPILLQT